MNKHFFLLFLTFAAITLGATAEDSIAIVDLQKIVSNSSQVKQLKLEHSKKLDELNKIVVNARGEIANETDTNKIIKIEEKYTNEFNTKKALLEKDYNNKLASIERNIKDEISKKAKELHYDYVFAKSVMLYGGKDITDEIHVK